MPVSVKRLRLAAWSIIAYVFSGLIYRLYLSDLFKEMSVGRLLLTLVAYWLSLTVCFIVLTTWKRIFLGVKPSPLISLAFNFILIVAVLACVNQSFVLITPDYLFYGWSKDQFVWSAIAAVITLVAVLVFALGGISESAMPEVGIIRPFLVVSVLGYSIAASSFFVYQHTSSDKALIISSVIPLIINAIPLLLVAGSLYFMFLKLARRAEKADEQQAEGPPTPP